MTILSELKQYAADCIDQRIPSCKKHVWACQRFLRDLSRVGNEDFPYIWDEEEAGKIVKWFALLRHSKGVLAGQPIILQTCQKFSLCQIYGWRHKDTGLRRFTQCFKEVARKNAKSQEQSGVILYEISCGSVKNGELYETYCAGTKRDQSKIVFNECINMLKGSPLRSRFKITQTLITHSKTGSFLKALSKEDGKKGDGTNPAVLVLDEYHLHENTDFYDLGLGANSLEPLLMIITTAGKDLNCPCYQQEYKLCSRILNPDVPMENDSYFVDIFEADPGDDIAAEDTLKKANPIRAFYPEGLEILKKAYKNALEIPEKMTAFLTKCLNLWVQARENGYMDMAKWNRCVVDKVPYDLRGASVYCGFDMSARIDLTSVSFIIPLQMEGVVKYVLYSHSFIPNREKLQERIAKDKQPYDAWERNGYITITDSEIVDQNKVMDYVLETCRKNQWEIKVLCFDPANAGKLMIDLSNEGFDVEEVYQSHRSLNEATAGFREQVYAGNIIVAVNPVLTFAMANAVVRMNNGLIKIDKDAAKCRVDPVDATLCGFKLALYHEFARDFDDDAWLDSDEW